MLNRLNFYTSTFRSMCAVPNMAIFCSSFTSTSQGTLKYFLNDFEMIPFTRIIISITFVFTFHMHGNSVVRSLYFGILAASHLMAFLSPEIVTSISIYVPFHYHGLGFWSIVNDSPVGLHLLIP